MSYDINAFFESSFVIAPMTSSLSELKRKIFITVIIF